MGWALWWAVYALLYLGFVSQVTVPEAVAAAVVAALSVGLSYRAKRAAGMPYRLEVPRLLNVATVSWQFLQDTLVVTRALALHVTGRRRLQGRFVAVPFDLEQGDEGTGRDTAVTVETFVSPNTYIAGYDRDRGLLLLHQLVDKPDPKGSYPRWSSGARGT